MLLSQCVQLLGKLSLPVGELSVGNALELLSARFDPGQLALNVTLARQLQLNRLIGSQFADQVDIGNPFFQDLIPTPGGTGKAALRVVEHGVVEPLYGLAVLSLGILSGI